MESKLWRRHYEAGYNDGYLGREFNPQGNSDDTCIAYEEGFEAGKEERMKEIANFNKQAVDYIIQNGTLEIEKDSKTLLIEVDAWKRDDSPDGFVGWFRGEDHTQIFGDTPYEVYCDA